MRIVSMNNNGQEAYDARAENFKNQECCDNAFSKLTKAGFDVEEYEEMELTIAGDKDEYYTKKEFISEIRKTIK